RDADRQHRVLVLGRRSDRVTRPPLHRPDPDLASHVVRSLARTVAARRGLVHRGQRSQRRTHDRRSRARRAVLRRRRPMPSRPRAAATRQRPSARLPPDPQDEVLASGSVVAMLSELRVENLGIIAELQVTLGPGLTVITGETGAGKTLIVDALELLCGGRADPQLVREGAAEARVEGRFEDGDVEVVLARVVPADGRSRGYVNGRLATVAELAECGRRLVDLHGQHTHQSLLAPVEQRTLLDRFAGAKARRWPLRTASSKVQGRTRSAPRSRHWSGARRSRRSPHVYASCKPRCRRLRTTCAPPRSRSSPIRNVYRRSRRAARSLAS